MGVMVYSCESSSIVIIEKAAIQNIPMDAFGLSETFSIVYLC